MCGLHFFFTYIVVYRIYLIDIGQNLQLMVCGSTDIFRLQFDLHSISEKFLSL